MEKTDLEKFIELYASLGIKLKVNLSEEWTRYENGAKVTTPDCKSIIFGGDCYEPYGTTSSEHFEGYSGFYTKVIFDKDGKFLKQGFWE